MSTFSVAIIVVLIFLVAVWFLLNRYRKQLLGCQLWLSQPHMVKRIGLTQSIGEYYLAKVKKELPMYQTMWPMLCGFAIGDILLCWIVLPLTQTPNALSVLAACLIATVMTRALTIEDRWVVELLQKFNDPAPLVADIQKEMKVAEPELKQALKDLDLAQDELIAAAKELEEELRKIYEAAQSISESSKKDKKD